MCFLLESPNFERLNLELDATIPINKRLFQNEICLQKLDPKILSTPNDVSKNCVIKPRIFWVFNERIIQ